MLRLTAARSHSRCIERRRERRSDAGSSVRRHAIARPTGRQGVPRAQLERRRARRTVGERLRVIAPDDGSRLIAAQGPRVIKAKGNRELGPKRRTGDGRRRATSTEACTNGAGLLFWCVVSDVMNRMRRYALAQAGRLRHVRRVAAVHRTGVRTSRLRERGGEPQSPNCDEEAIPKRMPHRGIIQLLLGEFASGRPLDVP